jgi:DNA-binding IclR family transcriptional regulator
MKTTILVGNRRSSQVEEGMTVKAASSKKIPDAPPEDKEGKQPLYSAPALEKGLDILELLSKEENGLSRKDIADRLGRSVGEIFRMIECLARRSYLVQTDESFLLGMKLFELSHSFPPVSRLISEALPRMKTLSTTIDQSCHLTVLSGNHQLVVAQVDAPEGVGFNVKVGAKLDILKSASGRVLLAFQGSRALSEILSLIDPTMKQAEQQAFIKLLQKVQKQGFAFMKSNQFAGVQAICFPILDLREHAIAALTVPYVARLDDQTRPPTDVAQAALAAVAAELTGVLGGKASPVSPPAGQNRLSGKRPRQSKSKVT